MARSLGQSPIGPGSDASLRLFDEALRRERLAWVQRAQSFALKVVIRRTAGGLEVILPDNPIKEVP